MATETSGRLLDIEEGRGKLWDGGWAPASERLLVREPASGETLAEVGAARGEDVLRAAAAAAAVQPGWEAVPASERAEIIDSAAELLEQHREEVVEWNVRECGAVQAKAAVEVQLSVGELRAAATLTAARLDYPVDDQTGRRSVNRRVPIGVVGVITPWNFPLFLSLRSLAPALALGNTVVLKPDPHTPVSGGLIIARLLAEAGLPAGALQVVPGGAEAGEAICDAPEIGMVSFTGSSAVGRKVGARAGGNLKRVTLELGGKNAFIVLDDAPVDGASSAGAWGSFWHQGQICMASGRHIVHERIADDYIAALAERARRLPVGDPMREQVALGPMIDETQLSRVSDIVRDATDHGAVVQAGGEARPPYFDPTVLSGVNGEMRVWREEIFGPVAPVVTFSHDDEAIALANDTHYGLSAGIYTTSPDRGRAIAAHLRTGLVHIGDQPVNDDPAVCFGGMGASGNGGRFGGPANIEEFTQWRWLTERDEPAQYPF